MPDIVMTEAELEALARCSGVAVKAYLRLRSRMDFSTGLVGVKSGMSYQALREWTEEAIEKGTGETVVQPTLRNVRTAVAQLERRGLLHRAKTEKLVFLCPLARCGEVRPNQTRHEPGRAKQAEPGTNPAGSKPVMGAGFGVFVSAEPDTNPAGQNRPNPADIRYPIKTSTPQPPSTTGREVDAAGVLSGADRLAAGWVGGSDPLSPLDRKVVELVAWLRRNGAAVQPANPKVRAWVEEGIDEGLIGRALDVAKDTRGPSPQPVNAGLLDAIVRRLLVEEAQPRRRNWAVASDGELMDRARALGVHTVGRSRAEVAAAIQAREGGAGCAGG